MPGINGIEVAREIRKNKIDTEIIFVTTSDEFAVSAFSVKATHYLLKPFSSDEFGEAMDRALCSLKINQPTKLVVKSIGRGVHGIDLNDIVYIESFNHVQQIHMRDGDVLEVRESISGIFINLEELSKNQFILPFKGYIINLNAVQSVEKNGINLYGGFKIPLVRRNFKEIVDKFFAYTFNDNKFNDNTLNKNTHSGGA